MVCAFPLFFLPSLPLFPSSHPARILSPSSSLSSSVLTVLTLDVCRLVLRGSCAAPRQAPLNRADLPWKVIRIESVAMHPHTPCWPTWSTHLWFLSLFFFFFFAHHQCYGGSVEGTGRLGGKGSRVMRRNNHRSLQTAMWGLSNRRLAAMWVSSSICMGVI